MKYFLISFLLLFSLSLQAQQYITDEQVSTTVMEKDDELKILYFTASWCGPCKYMKPIIKEIDENPNLDVTIYKMDIDENYTDDVLKVHSVPTFIYLKNGIKMGQSRGAKSKQIIEKTIAQYSAKQAEGGLLKYNPIPSNLEPIAGAHPKLTVRTIKKLWHDAENLLKLSITIEQQLQDPKDLKSALVMTKRSLEIEKTEEAEALIKQLNARLK